MTPGAPITGDTPQANAPSARLAIVGCTASGKSAAALTLARARPGVELISADSMQIYRGMDIGTAKPSAAEQAEVRHHLIDRADPGDEFSVSEYQHHGRVCLAELAERDAIGVLVGGTGLYVQAMVDGWRIPGRFPGVRDALDARLSEDPAGVTALHAELRELDPIAAGRMEPTNARRVVRALEVTLGSGQPFSSYGPGVATFPAVDTVLVGLSLPRTELDQRIARRYEAQMAAGFLDEVRSLLDGPGLGRTARQALGYKELADHLEGRCTLEEALDLAHRRTRQFARRQERWFRRDPRVMWLDATRNPMEVMHQMLEVFDRCV